MKGRSIANATHRIRPPQKPQFRLRDYVGHKLVESHFMGNCRILQR